MAGEVGWCALEMQGLGHRLPSDVPGQCRGQWAGAGKAGALGRLATGRLREAKQAEAYGAHFLQPVISGHWWGPGWEQGLSHKKTAPGVMLGPLRPCTH